ncbi:murein transglycosylase A [Dichotomicrobium thermohalophilum]|uniref:peptidoglycan lytic exotransglycosylase n=1 Tax=Dichotomicrobium thermohalophilum TaxID=933063 RepID=A0A397PNV1_9HYPH|nr:MltA domain-containing protein [Dichotomicrobium thermohalophilum]RIA47714.1 membrane-bound lytic murein transglycosylase A [Dichotomicrobium thermohalophilum]
MSAAWYFTQAFLFTLFVFLTVELWHWQFPDTDGDKLPLQLDRVSFADIPGWAEDDHAKAFAAFRRSCPWSVRIAKRHDTEQRQALAWVCERAMALSDPLEAGAARDFFETYFTAYRVRPQTDRQLVTGYYEPEIQGSRTKTEKFNIPIYRPPDDLTLIKANAREGLPEDLTAARQTEDGLKAHFTRKEIEQGALEGLGLELAWIADPVAHYSMQLQGSGRIRFQDGTAIRLGFAGKNGFPYTSIGQEIISRGELKPHEASLANIFAWAEENGEKGQELIWSNKSYIFFRELSEAEGAVGPVGALGTSLTPLRSLAVDPRYHLLGAPIWVAAPKLDDDEQQPFRRLMIAQDTGSAIRGDVRGDIYWGSGVEAHDAASRTKHDAGFTILLPNAAR